MNSRPAGVPGNARHTVVRLAPVSARIATPAPRLRFDRVVLRLMTDLQSALAGTAPDGTTALVTLTAPIRLPGRTAAAIADVVRARIARGSARDLVTILHGNGVRVRIVAHTLMHAPPLIGFVHNPEPQPQRLLDCATEWLAVLGRASARRRRTTGERWLRAHGSGRLAFAAVDGHVCSQLLCATPFSAIVVVDSSGREAVVATR